MRLVYGLLALFNLRWATADLARADRLTRDVDDAHSRAEARLRVSRSFLERAQALRA